MRDMICKLMEDAGLKFGENVSDGNGGTVRYGGWRKRGGWVAAGNSAREVRQSLLGLKRRDERQFIRKAVAGAGLRLTIHERSVPDNGEIVSSILYRGWSDDGEEVVSGSCLGEILESLEKWREKGRAELVSGAGRGVIESP